MMTQKFITPAMQKKAEQLAPRVPLLSRGYSKINGRHFWVMPASDGLHSYMVAQDASGCTCRGFFYRGICAHVAAVRAYNASRTCPVCGAPALPNVEYATCDDHEMVSPF